MKRILATATVLAAVGVLIAAPVPAETRKPAAFPAGHYVLAGAGEPATGNDAFEFTKPFRLRPGQYVLSGGPKPTDAILVDDDLELFQDKERLFVDDDRVRTTETRGKLAARYQGLPIVLVLDPAKKLRVHAIDCAATEAVVGPLWLHRWDGARKKLTDGKQAASPAALPAAFFDESFALADGFEMPEKVSTDAAIDVPEKPASLLPRFRREPVPVAAELPRPIKVDEFLFESIRDGLAEDGVAPALARALANRETDYVVKCPICANTRKAFSAHGDLKDAPAAKDGKGLPEELAKRLKSDTDATRRLALRELVQRYIGRGYVRGEFTAAERAAVQKELEQWRKDAMPGLREGQMFCPSCDGACRLTPKL